MIQIRIAQPDDVEGILEIYAPFILNSTTSFETEVPTTDSFWQRIEKILPISPWLVCEIEGKVAGYAYASQHRSRTAYDWSREVSVYVHPDFHKRKIATALYQAIIDLLKVLGYCNVFAGITMPNPRSVAFHKNFGFEPVGTYKRVGYKFGEWRDTYWMQLFIGDPSAQAPKIKSMQDMDASEMELILNRCAGMVLKIQ